MGMQELLLGNELLLLQRLKLKLNVSLLQFSSRPLLLFLCVMPGLDFLSAASPTARASKRGRLDLHGNSRPPSSAKTVEDLA
jgi:hypothetical protein